MTVRYVCTDTLSGIAGSCPTDVIVSSTTPAAGQDVSASVSDNAGNNATSNTINVKVDKTPPTISASATKADATTYTSGTWSNQTVTVHFTCSDVPSGLTAACPADVVVSANTSAAGQDVSASVADNAGNSATSNTVNVKVDKTGPLVTASATKADSTSYTPGSWTNQTVTVHFTCSDALSGVLAGSCPADAVIAADTPATGQNVFGSVSDNAGNSATSNTINVKVDKTAADATATPDRSPDHNGWYNHSFTVHYAGNDHSGSGIASCTADQTYSGPATISGLLSGSCTDNAGNSTLPGFSFKYDDSAPSASLTVTAGTSGANGWYTSAVTVSTSGTDATSAPVTCTADQFQTTETAGAAFAGSCTNDAGLSTNAAPLTVKLDKTAPSAALAVTAGTSGTNGWYTSNVTVSTSGSDSISEPTICTGDQFQTTETAGSPFNGSCTNDAGLTTSATTLTVKLDKSKPSAALAVTVGTLGANGWYTSNVTVSTSGSDSISEPTTCTGDQFQADETSGAQFNGSCTNDAGLTTDAAPLTVRLDKTAPSAELQVTAGTPGLNGWFTSNVTVHTSGSDSISSPVNCTADQFQTDETTGTDVNGSCTNDAGLTQNALKLTIKLDKTAPVITDLGPTTNANSAGWYNHDVVNRFKAEDGTSGLDAACLTAFPASGGDRIQSRTTAGEGTAVHVTSDGCSDEAGNSVAGKQSADFKIDQTNPVITDLGATTPPNGAGWYNHNVTNRFKAEDALSGLDAACGAAFPLSAGDHLQDQTTNTEGAAVHVTSDGCSDVAGNSVAGKQSGDFQIDKTTPAITNVGLQSGTEGNDGWYVSAVVNRFHAADSLSGFGTACQLAFPSGIRDVSTGSSEGCRP